MADYSKWINKPDTTNSYLSVEQANLMAATINQDSDFEENSVLPNAWHWLYFHNPIKTENLAVDGHEKLGSFIPPLPQRHRMWAGGSMEFIFPIKLGTKAKKISTVKSVVPKTGRSGTLCFVNVNHRIEINQQTCLDETQTIVYRDSISNSNAPPTVPDDFPSTDFTKQWTPSAIMLFRYSALTFNSHLIHYDADYCRQMGYDNLIIHGPLNAIFLLQTFKEFQPNINLKKFDYQAKSPLFIPSSLSVNLAIKEAEKSAFGWVESKNKQLVIQANFYW